MNEGVLGVAKDPHDVDHVRSLGVVPVSPMSRVIELWKPVIVGEPIEDPNDCSD